MAHKTYNEEWKESMEEVLNLLEIESNETNAILTCSVEDLTRHYGVIYLKYLQIFRRLCDCYDQMVHPQKRLEVKRMLEAVMGRLLEIRELLIRAEQSPYPILDEYLVDMKFPPEALEVPIPKYFIEERAKELEERDKLLNVLLQQLPRDRPESRTKGNENLRESLLSSASGKRRNSITLEEAVKIIQINERGRQARAKARIAKELRKQEKSQGSDFKRKGFSSYSQDSAATLIQKVWRGHMTRIATHNLRKDELVFLGMEDSSRFPAIKSGGNNANAGIREGHIERAEGTKVRRKLIQNQNEVEYKLALTNIRKNLVDIEGPDMKEKIQDDVRHYFLAHKEQTGRFPMYPPAKDGGSAKMLNLKTPATINLPTTEKTKTAKGKNEKTEKNPKKTDTAKKDKTSASASPPKRMISYKEKKKAPPPRKELVLPPSQFLVTMQSTAQTYVDIWQGRDESGNFPQKHDPMLIKEILRPEVEDEIRTQVDEVLRAELEQLKTTVEKKIKVKKEKKSAKPKFPVSAPLPVNLESKKEDSEAKKVIKSPKQKKKRNNDLTANQSIQSLYAELVNQGFIVKPPEVHMKDFIGVYPLLASELKAMMKSPRVNNSNPRPDPSLFDVKRAVTECCILPLGSDVVRNGLSIASPINSVLFYGAAGSGKTMLAHAVAIETGALFVNLSPSVIKGKVTTNKGAKLLIHTIFKVARAMGPTVILIEEAEKMFVKSKKKESRSPSPSRSPEPRPQSSKEATNANGNNANTNNNTDETTNENDATKTSTLPPATPLNPNEVLQAIKRELTNAVSLIAKNERILVIGCTRTPYLSSSGNALISFFNRHLRTGRPDYPSRIELWKHFISLHGGTITPHLEINSLAYVSEGYTAGSIAKVVSSVVNHNRMQMAEKKPLISTEFVEQLSKTEIVLMEYDELLRKFESGLPKPQLKYKIVEDAP